MLNFKITNLLAGFILLLLAGLAFTETLVVSWWAYAALLTGYLGILTAGTMVLSLQFFIPVRSHGVTSSNAIAITFDDGPIPGNTEKVLSLLRAYHAPAAFFCIGHRVAAHPELVRQMYREGHLVCNHSYWHKNTFDLQSTAKIAHELAETNRIIRDTIGVVARFFRPPYGVTNPMVAAAIRQGAFTAIGWSVRSFDTISEDQEALLKRVTSGLKGGDIVLFHDYCSITIEILPRFLDYAAQAGLKIVRVDELLNEKAYAAG